MRPKHEYIRPRKSLGQSFLKDNNIIDKIVDSCQFQKEDTVLEIGPGHGELTQRILERVEKLVVVEIDSRLCKQLREVFSISSNLEIINSDILEFNINRHFSRSPGRIKVIGNIPYYITSPILEHLFNYLGKIDAIFLTVQKEFARRIVSLPGTKDYGAFSCFVQYYANPQPLFFIKRGSFRPIPKVDSAFIKLKIREVPAVKVDNEQLLFKIIRTAFSQRRKKISNSLKAIVPPQVLSSFFVRYGVDSGLRPEDLSLQDFANLANLTTPVFIIK